MFFDRMINSNLHMQMTLNPFMAQNHTRWLAIHSCMYTAPAAEKYKNICFFFYNYQLIYIGNTV